LCCRAQTNMGTIEPSDAVVDQQTSAWAAAARVLN
jgi:hypothetical protein